MIIDQTRFEVRLAQSEAEIEAAQRLRYIVFVEEMGANGPDVDHAVRLERDEFDPVFDHLLLIDHAKNGEVVGVYRLLPGDRQADIGGFYSSHEYDLSPLLSSNRKLLELGRSCLHKDYRGGVALHQLWSGLARYVQEHDYEILFGVASFPGTDIDALAEPLSYLNEAHLAPKDLRVRALNGSYKSMDMIPSGTIDRVRAMQTIPALIKAYLRVGGVVGDGAYIDHNFNTVDVCMILDTTRLSQQAKRRYGAQS